MYVSWPGNGHFYGLVEHRRYIPWDEASADAVARGGYLATLTSAGENQFVWDLIMATTGQTTPPFNLARWYWLGGFQPQPVDPANEPDKTWSWVTGEPWVYSNWSPMTLTKGDCSPTGTPAPWNNCQNQTRGDADYLHFVRDAPGMLWGDVEFDQVFMTGYVVEFNFDPNPAPSVGPIPLISGGLVILGSFLSRRRRETISATSP